VGEGGIMMDLTSSSEGWKRNAWKNWQENQIKSGDLKSEEWNTRITLKWFLNRQQFPN
jgi:hypothetical protein